MFESDEHSIPAFAAPVWAIVLVPAATIVAELAEILTNPVLLMLRFSKTTVMLLSSISTKCSVEDPVTDSIDPEISFAPLQVTVPADTFTGPIVMSQVIVERNELIGGGGNG
jgi:hypothetical protein